MAEIPLPTKAEQELVKQGLAEAVTLDPENQRHVIIGETLEPQSETIGCFVVGYGSYSKSGKYNALYGTHSIVHSGDHNSIYGNYCSVTGDRNAIYGSKCTINGNRNSVWGTGNKITGSGNTVVGNNQTIDGDNIVVHVKDQVTIM